MSHTRRRSISKGVSSNLGGLRSSRHRPKPKRGRQDDIDSAESKSSGAVLDVLLNKEVLSIIFEFVPVVEKVFDSAEFNNVLAFQVVSKTWKTAIGNCDNVWIQFFFRKFALCIRNGYTAYTRKTSGTIEDWQLHGYTWKPSVNSFSLNKQALFLLALLDSDPNVPLGRSCPQTPGLPDRWC